jgi:hypothetical protein
MCVALVKVSARKKIQIHTCKIYTHIYTFIHIYVNNNQQQHVRCVFMGILFIDVGFTCTTAVSMRTCMLARAGVMLDVLVLTSTKKKIKDNYNTIQYKKRNSEMR